MPFPYHDDAVKGKQSKKSRSDATRLVQNAARRAADATAAENLRKRQASRQLSQALSRETSPDSRPEDAAATPLAGSQPPAPIQPLSADAPPQAAPQPGPEQPSGQQARADAPSLRDVMTAISQLTAVVSKLAEDLAASRAATVQAEERAVAAEQRATAAEQRACTAVEKVQSLNAGIEELKAAIARADQRQEQLDRAQRRASMVFRGVPEGSEESLKAAVEQKLRAVACPAADAVVEAVRIGARAPTTSGSANRSRPVRVTLAPPTAVYEVFKASRALREQHHVFVDRDLTPQQQAVRASLMGEYKQLRENGRKPFWRGERLFTAGEHGARPKEVRPGDQGPAATPAQTA